MKFRPCIDLHKGKVKQIIGSSLSESKVKDIKINFESDRSPAHYSKMYKHDNLKGGHIIMLGPGNENAAISALSAYPGGFHLGGGITPENALDFINKGASHVIITSYVFKDGKINWENLEKCTNKIGKKKLILDLSCINKNGIYYVATDRWQKLSNVAVSEENLLKLSVYCDEFLIHAVDKEGKLEGIDLELISLLASYSPIKTTYAGGVRSLKDIERINTHGKGRIDVTIGSALDIFGGNLSYSSVVSWHKTQNPIPRN